MSKVFGLVTFQIYPAEMGGQKGVAEFYEYLSAHHEVILAVSSDNAIEKENVFPVLFSNKGIIKNLRRLGQLKSLVRRHKLSAIIAEHSYPAWIAWLLARSCVIPFIIHSHNIESLRFQKMKRRWWKVYWHYEKWIHRKADHSFFISQDDMEFAVREFSLDPSLCSVITYGIGTNTPFRGNAKPEKLFLFNGSLDYLPNEEAVHLLADIINPILRTRLRDYRIMISGKGASPSLLDKIGKIKEMEFLGYVPDLPSLFSRVSVFLNPVLNDTGIKTKVVEAIGHHCTVVSTASGAAGMQKDVCGKKLKIIADDDWTGFAEAVIAALEEEQVITPAEYFHFYSWRNIAKKAASEIDATIERHIIAHINDRI